MYTSIYHPYIKHTDTTAVDFYAGTVIALFTLSLLQFLLIIIFYLKSKLLYS